VGLGALSVMCVGDRWSLSKPRQKEDDHHSWARLVWSDFIGACALAALLAGVLTLSQCA
jgi:hypothetical protein